MKCVRFRSAMLSVALALTAASGVRAAALRAGNDEFDACASRNARDIAVRRLQAETARQGLATGALEKAMLADPARYARTEEAERLCRAEYAEGLARQYADRVAAIARELGVKPAKTDDCEAFLRGAVERHFPAAFTNERAAAVAAQARTLAGSIRPREADVDTMDESKLLEAMSARIATQQKTAVFEENYPYISKTIVAPVLAKAKGERERQRQHVKRAKCEGYAPERIRRELAEDLRSNIARRRTQETDPANLWEVFPSVLDQTIPQVADRRALERAARCVDDVSVKVDVNEIARRIDRNRRGHRRQADSERIFRGDFTGETLNGAIAAAEREAPADERAAFAAHVRGHAKDPILAKAVEVRVKRDLLPRLAEARQAYAVREAAHLWPALADGTWCPAAELADAVAARSDYKAQVRAWRKLPDLASFAAAERTEPLEETSALADGAIATAFERARSAIASQNAILTAATPDVLAEAKRRQASFFRRTPDFAKVVELLTEAVQDEWSRTKVATLWPDGPKPKNAAEQHAALFPSVRRRIELVARTILEEMAEDETPPVETPEEPLQEFSIVVRRDGACVDVRLDQGGKTLIEKRPKAERDAFGAAMREVSEKLGRDVLNLP